jgi:fructokinase
MRVTIAGHITIDTITSDRIQTRILGGSPCYAGLTVKNMGGEVFLLTKYGEDLPEEYLLWLIRNQLKIPKDARSTTHRTTRFKIVQTLKGRELYLERRCEDLKMVTESLEGHAVIVSPVAGEVDLKLLSDIRRGFKTVYLDPQGFIRRFHPDGRCFLENMDSSLLKYADIVKIDEEEAHMVTGRRDPLQALEHLVERGVKIAIYTRGSEGILLRCSEGVFKIPVVRKVKFLDTTGVGDIFAGAFALTYLQSENSVWSGCVAVAASSIELDKVGLSKVPDIEAVAEVAEETRKKTEKI